MPTDPFGPGETALNLIAGANPVMRAWLRPVVPILPTLKATEDKPVGQFTMRELLAWAAVLGYIGCSVALAETLALNVLRVAVRGR